jgi:hypothetical protein
MARERASNITTDKHVLVSFVGFLAVCIVDALLNARRILLLTLVFSELHWRYGQLA